MNHSRSIMWRFFMAIPIWCSAIFLIASFASAASADSQSDVLQVVQSVRNSDQDLGGVLTVEPLHDSEFAVANSNVTIKGYTSRFNLLDVSPNNEASGFTKIERQYGTQIVETVSVTGKRITSFSFAGAVLDLAPG